MRIRFLTLEDILAADLPLDAPPNQSKTSRLTRSTGLEDMIYSDLYQQDERMRLAESKLNLSSAEELARDVFQCFYSLNLRFTDKSRLTVEARECNLRILEQLLATPEFEEIRATCEGHELSAFEAAVSFIERISDAVESLKRALDSAGKGKLQALERLEQQRDQLLALLCEMLAQNGTSSSTPGSKPSPELLHLAEQVASLYKQAQAVAELLNLQYIKEGPSISQCISKAAKAAAETAAFTRMAETCWGTGEGTPRKNKENRELLERLRNNPQLLAIMRHLGRMMEMISDLRHNAYHYGRGEKYSLTLGKDLKNVLSGELAMLATPETTTLFLRRLANGSLKQYARREKIRKGMGDIIVCLDESGSTMGEKAAWGKAFALAMLNICAHDKRKFAIVHFASDDEVETSLFLPGQYTTEGVLQAAEHFFDGGTDFEAPLEASMKLIAEQEFNAADIIFITDGLCRISEDFRKRFAYFQSEFLVTVQGLLLDMGDADDFSLKSFCERVAATSDLAKDEHQADMIAQEFFTKHI